MPTIRQRLANILLGDELRRLRATTHALTEAYWDGPFVQTPTQLLTQLREYDSAVLQDLVNQLQWDVLGTLGQGTIVSDSARKRQVDESRRLWTYNPLAQWSVWTWTNYGFGNSISVTCKDESLMADEETPLAQSVFDEMWERNQLFSDDSIQELSYDVLVDGEEFIVCNESTVDGTVTFSTILSDEIQDIISDPAYSRTPLFYKRVFSDANGASRTLYYPDWHAYNYGGLDAVTLPANAQRTDKPNAYTSSLDDDTPATVAYILHISHNRKDRKSLRGWPILGIGAPYARAHKTFVENRLTVSAQKASFVREFTTGGGSRAVAAIKSKLASTQSSTNYDETNPPSAQGNLIHNQAVSMKDLPMSTGASDAKTDNEMFSWMTLISWGLFPTTAGMDASRWATALAMDKTQSTQWSRYQTFWASQFQRIAEITLRAYERGNGVKLETYAAEVSIDSLDLVDFPAVVSPLSQLISTAMTPLIQSGVMPVPAAKRIAAELWQIALQALGTNDPDLTNDAAFEIETEAPTVSTGQPENDQESLVLYAIPKERPILQVTNTLDNAEMRETIGQVLREYRDEFENIVYRALNTIKRSGYEPSDVLRQGIKEQVRNDIKALIRRLGPDAYAEGIREGGVDPDEMDNEDLDAIQSWVSDQLSFVNGFAGDLVAAAGDSNAERSVIDRVDMWVQSMDTLGSLGRASATKNEMGEWRINGHHETEDHCQTCLGMDGVKHRVKWFIKNKIIPRQQGSETLSCHGWDCGCAVVSVKDGRLLL